MVKIFPPRSSNIFVEIEKAKYTTKQDVVSKIINFFKLPSSVDDLDFYQRSNEGLVIVSNILNALSFDMEDIEFHSSTHKILIAASRLLAIPLQSSKEEIYKYLQNFEDINCLKFRIFDTKTIDYEYDLQKISTIPDGTSVNVSIVVDSYFPDDDKYDEIYEFEAEIKQEEKKESGISCLSCFDLFDSDNIFTVPCQLHHSFCFPCIFRYLESGIIGDNVIPFCPMTPAHHYMFEHEVLQGLISTLIIKNEFKTNHEADWGITPSQEDCFVSQKLDLMYNRWRISAMRLMRCPNANCQNAILPADDWDGNQQRYDCVCGTSYCVKCNYSPYHTNCDCEEIINLNGKWLQWIQSGRREYLEQLLARNNQYKNLLNDFNKKCQQHQQESKAAQDRLGQLASDENYKAIHCKLCPHCNRIVQKTAGCNTMLCGSNFHGGNMQFGCGKSFEWESAEPYQPQLNSIITIPTFNAQHPEQIQEIIHISDEGGLVLCRNCNETISGPRICCIYCFDANFCLSCQDNATDVSSPHHGHVFAVITDSNDRFGLCGITHLSY